MAIDRVSVIIILQNGPLFMIIIVKTFYFIFYFRKFII